MILHLMDLFSAFDELERGGSVVLGDGNPDPPDGAEPWLGLFTSGTTREPRLQWHRWGDLRNAAIAAFRLQGWSWASPFRMDSFAGVQVALHAWLAKGRCLALRGPWLEQWALLDREQPEVLSATPTFADLLVVSEPVRPHGFNRWSPRQLTLGGEPLREPVARRLRARFPESRWTVIYATAEAGVIARTHREDGWFAVSDLVPTWESWRVVEGCLQLKRGCAWIETGDRVEVVGDVFRVLGRTGRIANVGGTKVGLSEVEALAETVPGVQQAIAAAVTNAVSGQVVKLHYALLPGAESSVVRDLLQGALRSGLRKEAWPRVWEEVPAGLGPNAKKALS